MGLGLGLGLGTYNHYCYHSPGLVEQKCGTSLPSGRPIKLPTCVTSKLSVAGSLIW